MRILICIKTNRISSQMKRLKDSLGPHQSTCLRGRIQYYRSLVILKMQEKSLSRSTRRSSHTAEFNVFLLTENTSNVQWYLQIEEGKMTKVKIHYWLQCFLLKTRRNHVNFCNLLEVCLRMHFGKISQSQLVLGTLRSILQRCLM